MYVLCIHFVVAHIENNFPFVVDNANNSDNSLCRLHGMLNCVVSRIDFFPAKQKSVQRQTNIEKSRHT